MKGVVNIVWFSDVVNDTKRPTSMTTVDSRCHRLGMGIGDDNFTDCRYQTPCRI